MIYVKLLMLIVWLPISIPLIFIGMIARLCYASIWYGFVVMDDILNGVNKLDKKKETK
jgi:hypothetical protein